ncbi:ankyrin repeat domain-containing protein [Mariniflexile maritimum]|uniref:ankyrin repeat domain-containing protein n=1 Tax=Mariniflexile maritimum TaxID=2682493 RepID=UPI0012F68808|nr:ankyrin repeat domain-containing protein [Mariniflexile maritimum]
MEIFKAIAKKDKELVAEFIEMKNCNINKVNDFHSNLLMTSIFEGAGDISLYLIDKGINLSYQNQNGETVLHYLTHYYDENVLLKVLEKGIDVNISDKYGNIPLWYAIHNDKGFGTRNEMIKLLVHYGSDINHLNNVNKSVIQMAKNRGYPNVIEILEKTT